MLLQADVDRTLNRKEIEISFLEIESEKFEILFCFVLSQSMPSVSAQMS